MTSVVGQVLIAIGLLLILITGVGLLKLPDVFSRMHAASKTTSLGLTFVFIGTAFLHGTFEAGWKLVFATAFLLFTQPVAVHVLARAAHSAGVPLWDSTLWDELQRPAPETAEDEPAPEG